ncbi:MAG: hypothetical protein HOB82_01650 [Alphaproteobacteria bacterium]|nr:hypothetical protein [Alphaproteobacteria bacterium]MBT4710217.1 hypothetical protein [Alphaproteobacteria bacterium]
MTTAPWNPDLTGVVGSHSHNEEVRVWRNMLLTLFLYRSVMSVVAQVVIPEFTSLGDSGVRQQDSLALGTRWFLDSNMIWINLGGLFGFFLFGSKILINIAFQALAFLGLYQVLRALPVDLRNRMFLLMFLPSFTLWSSISGKDAIVVFAMGYAVGFLIDLHYGRARLRLGHLVAVWIVFVFKTHYAPALLYAFGMILIFRHVRHKAIAALAAGAASLLPLYWLRDVVDELSFAVAPHFESGRSTREVFWVDQFDVFWRAPYGMFQSFMGPTMTEAMTSGNVMQIATYFEGLFIIFVLVFYAARNLPRLPVHALIFSTFSLFWILFPNYPFGILNPGSAIRYRADYGLFVFAIFAVFLSTQAYSQHKKEVPRSNSVP